MNCLHDVHVHTLRVRSIAQTGCAPRWATDPAPSIALWAEHSPDTAALWPHRFEAMYSVRVVASHEMHHNMRAPAACGWLTCPGATWPLSPCCCAAIASLASWALTQVILQIVITDAWCQIHRFNLYAANSAASAQRCFPVSADLVDGLRRAARQQHPESGGHGTRAWR